MSNKITFSMIFLITLVLIPSVSAEVMFTNDIDISEGSIRFTLEEIYSGEDTGIFRNDLDTNGNGIVEESELDSFEAVFLSSRADQFLEYVILDGDVNSLKIDSVELNFEGAGGDIDDIANNELVVSTDVSYILNQSGAIVSLSSGEHNIWILGHPLIVNMKISLPSGMSLISHAGIDNMTQSVEDGRIVLDGSSGVRSFMVNEKPTFEYAVSLDISKKEFYEQEYFLPLIVLIELCLALLGFYIYKMNKIK